MTQILACSILTAGAINMLFVVAAWVNHDMDRIVYTGIYSGLILLTLIGVALVTILKRLEQMKS